MATLRERLANLQGKVEAARAAAALAIPNSDEYNPIEQRLLEIEGDIQQLIAEEGTDPARKAFIELLLNFPTLGSAQVMLVRRGARQVNRIMWGWDEEGVHPDQSASPFPPAFDFLQISEIEAESATVSPALHSLAEDFRRLSLNQRPELTGKTLQVMVSLDGSEPDGLNIPQRLFNGPPNFSNFLDTVVVQKGIDKLCSKAEADGLITAEELILVNIVTMVARQIEREGDICEFSRKLGKRIQILILRGNIREGLLSKEAVKAIMSLS